MNARAPGSNRCHTRSDHARTRLSRPACRMSNPSISFPALIRERLPSLAAVPHVLLRWHNGPQTPPGALQQTGGPSDAADTSPSPGAMPDEAFRSAWLALARLCRSCARTQRPSLGLALMVGGRSGRCGRTPGSPSAARLAVGRIGAITPRADPWRLGHRVARSSRRSRMAVAILPDTGAVVTHR